MKSVKWYNPLIEMENTAETWKPVRGYEDLYKVSNLGRVWSLRNNKERRSGAIKAGYRFIPLNNKGAVRNHFVHRIVADAFLGPLPHKSEINHKDGDKTNNHLPNLEVVTRSENLKHRIHVLGIKPLVFRGEDSGNAVITEGDVRNIRRLKREGKGAPEIARILGFGNSCVAHVYHGRTWKHVNCE